MMSMMRLEAHLVKDQTMTTITLYNETIRYTVCMNLTSTLRGKMSTF